MKNNRVDINDGLESMLFELVSLFDNKNPKLKNTITNILKILKKFTYCDLIEFWQINNLENTIDLKYLEFEKSDKDIKNYIKNSNLQKYTTSDYKNTPVWLQQKTIWVPITKRNKVLKRQNLAIESNLQTLIASPIKLNNKTEGILYIYFKEKFKQNSKMISLINICSTQLSVHIENEKNQSLINNFFSNSNDIVCITNNIGTIQKASNSFYKLFAGVKSVKELLLNNIKEINFKNTFEKEHIVNSKKIKIHWTFTILANEKLIIFSGKNISNNKELNTFLENTNELIVPFNNDLKSVLNNTNEILYKVDLKGTFIEVSDNVFNILGYTKNEITGKSFFDLTHINETESIYKAVSNLISTKKTITNLIHRVKTKNGSWKWFSSSGQVFFNINNEPIYTIGLSIDINENYQLQQKMFSEKEKYKKIFHQLEFPTLIYDPINDTIYNANEMACNLYGYTLDEMLKLSIANLKYTQALNDLNSINFLIEKYKKIDKNSICGVHHKKNGDKFIAEIKQKQILIDEKSLIIFTITDISNQIFTSLDVEEKNEMYEFFIKHNSDLIYKYESTESIPINGKPEIIIQKIVENFYLIDCNDALAKMYGFDNSSEIVGMQLGALSKFVTFDYLECFKLFIKNDFELIDYETTANYKNQGEKKIILSFKGQIKNNHLIRIWGTTKINNITKELEQKVEDININYNQLFYTINTTVYIFKTKNPISLTIPIKKQFKLISENILLTECNEFSLEKFGYQNRNQLLGTNLSDFFKLIHIDQTKAINYFIKKNYNLKDFKITTILDNNKEIITSNNVIGVIRNNCLEEVIISEKDITTEIIESRKSRTMGQVLSLLGDAVFICNNKKNIINWNKAAETIYGINEKDVLGKNLSEFIIFYDKNSFDLSSSLLEEKGVWSGELQYANPKSKKTVILLSTITKLLNDNELIYVVTSKDITERKKSELFLIESEERFRNLSDQAPVKIWMTNEKNKMIYCNLSWLQFTGKKIEEELSISIKDRVHPNDKELYENNFKNNILQKKAYSIEYRFLDKNSEYKWIVDKGNPRILSNGDFAGFIGVIVNINDLKETQLKLENANTNFELLNYASNEAIWESDLINNKISWNIGFKKLFGHKIREINTEYWLKLIHPEDIEKVKNTFIYLNQKELQKNNVLNCEYRLKKLDNTYAVVFDMAYVILNKKGVPVRMIGSKKDITAQKELELQLSKAELQKQLSINKALLEGQEKEKLELSQELHDNVNQLISTSKLYMEVAKRENKNNPMIIKAIETLNTAVFEIRKLSKSLNPITINQLTIIDAIEQLIDDIEITGKLKIKFDYSQFDYNITLPQLHLYLFRIVQEQLNNIIKYAHTKKASIELKNNQNYLNLKIEDKGIGFDTNKKSSGIGITNITNRVNLFKGAISITSAPQKGCLMEITIPLNIEYF